MAMPLRFRSFARLEIQQVVSKPRHGGFDETVWPWFRRHFLLTLQVETMKNIALVLAFSLLMVCGCGNKTKISGTVKYSDGTPVTKGNVVFDTGVDSFFGKINNDGTYVTGGTKEVEGIPSGTYKVWLSATESSENTQRADGTVGAYSTTPTVAKKYTSPNSTDLTFEVKSGGPRAFDIVVEKP